jgi:hypothetical protein
MRMAEPQVLRLAAELFVAPKAAQRFGCFALDDIFFLVRMVTQGSGVGMSGNLKKKRP